MPTDKSIMQEARRLATLQAKRRKLKTELRIVDSEIRAQKRTLRAVIQARTDRPWGESGAASKVFGTKAGE